MNTATIKRPKSQIYVIVGCMATFLVYFLALRKENEVDEILSTPMELNYPKLNKIYVDQRIDEYKKLGLDVSKLKDSVDGTQKKD